MSGRGHMQLREWTLVLPLLQLLALEWRILTPTVALQTAGCVSSADCSLLGDCSTDRQCVCDDGWTSHNCSVLDLAPARWGPNRQAYETNRSSWGGNVVKDPVTKLYHLFFSEMRVDGLHTYSQPGHCQLTTAASISPLGPFNTHRTVLRSSATGPISHNVQPQVGGDGAAHRDVPGAADDRQAETAAVDGVRNGAERGTGLDLSLIHI